MEKQNTHDSIGKEKIPFARQLVIATNFLYKKYQSLAQGAQRDTGDTDGIRGDLALEFLKKSLNSGVRVVASDAGSSADFLSELEKFKDKGLTLIASTTPARASQRRAAFQTAISLSEGKVIIYTQPEKASLVDYFIEISKPILEDKADIVVPKRDPKFFEQSYPPYMRESELRVNKTYDWLMQRAGLMKKDESFDWFFGPVVFKNAPEIAVLFLKMYDLSNNITSRIGAQSNPDIHSGSHYFPIIEALFRGFRVVSVEIPFKYPPTQKANEMSEEAGNSFQNKRSLDAAAYRLEAIHFLAFLKKDPRSKIREVH